MKKSITYFLYASLFLYPYVLLLEFNQSRTVSGNIAMDAKLDGAALNNVSDRFPFNVSDGHFTNVSNGYHNNKASNGFYYFSRFYHCGYHDLGFLEHIFPEYTDKLKNSTALTAENAKHTTETDVLVFGFLGRCEGIEPYVRRGSNQTIPWLEKHFHGKLIYFNGESSGGELWSEGAGLRQPKRPFHFGKDHTKALPKRRFHLGYVKDDCQSTRLHFMSRIFLRETEIHPYFLYEEKKPRSSQEKFLLYANSNCVEFREDAFDAIALLVKNSSKVVEFAGTCYGSNMTMQNKKKASSMMERTNWTSNFQRMGQYRFCLVMENTKVDGYITEKILNAFAGGCIPIYYGTEEIFDIFNPKAFIYYNISNPQPALNQIKFLEENQREYDKVMAEPIMLDGNKTLGKYFFVKNNHTLSSNGVNLFRNKVLKMLQGEGC